MSDHCHIYHLLEIWIPLVNELIRTYQIQHLKAFNRIPYMASNCCVLVGWDLQ